MTILEIEKFYQNDSKSYILEKNKEFLEWLNGLISKGYTPPLATVEELQLFINKVASWYLLKYYTTSSISLKQDSMSNEATFKALQRRLSHLELDLLSCTYRFASALDGKSNMNIAVYDLKNEMELYLQFSRNSGMIRKGEASLVSKVLATGISAPFSLLDFVSALKGNKEYDISEAQRALETHKIDLQLRKKLLEFIALSIIYSKNFIPAISIMIAREFAFEIEDTLGIKIDIDELVARTQVECKKDKNNYI